MNKLADWLTFSKTAPFAAAIVIVLLGINSGLDIISKLESFRNPKLEQVTNSEVNAMLTELTSTLRSTTSVLKELSTNNAEILREIKSNRTQIGDVKDLLTNAHERQVTRTEFKSEIDALKKKVDDLKK